ncbi:hypothetical protein C8R44DRAFT_885479 [Mycena epipterygia]|nr:hypothetical protein C8R44DRAFT_885479 [Mycena epipterygia]
MPPTCTVRVSQRQLSPRLAADAASTFHRVAGDSAVPAIPASSDPDDVAVNCVVPAASADLSRPTRAFSLEVDPARRLPPMARSAALRYIRGQPFVDQIALHMSNSCLYAHDGSEGAVYCFVELTKEEYDGVKDGTVSLAQLLPSLRVKFGCAKDVSHRREGYAKCDAGGHRRLWLFSFPTKHRYRIERLCHLAFLCDAERDIACCSGCEKFHRELWRFLQVARSFSDLKQMISEFLTAIGEHPVITEHDDHRYTYP